MTFGQLILATLIGTLSGFIFSLFLFWIKENIGIKRRQVNLKSNVRYEFEYNINLFKQYVDDLTKCLEKISLEEKKVYTNIDYEHFAYFFFREFYREGLACQCLHYEDVKRWSEIVAKHSGGAETYLLERLKDWRDSKINKEAASKAVMFERDQLKYSIEMMEYLKERIK